MNIENHLPGFNMEAEIKEFDFNFEEQTITVVWHMSLGNTIVMYSPEECPDTVWKEIYGVEDGKLTLLKTIQGKHVKQQVIKEHYIFDDGSN